jgi:hypothetical protein
MPQNRSYHCSYLHLARIQFDNWVRLSRVLRKCCQFCPVPNCHSQLSPSKEELVERIYRYLDEVNEVPVVYHWKYKMDEVAV